MTREDLLNEIIQMEEGDNFKIKSSTFVFGCSCMEIHENIVIVFGGYGTHFSIWDTEIYHEEEITDSVIKHIAGYHSDKTSWITLEECIIE